jgi:hypothetical protein
MLVLYHQGESHDPSDHYPGRSPVPGAQGSRSPARQNDWATDRESLDFYGIKSREQALSLVRQARAHSQMREDQAMALAQSEVMLQRKPS